MMPFLTTPIFFLTPYIFIWAILNGLIVVGLLKRLKITSSSRTQIATGLSTAIAIILWNWSLEFNQSTIHLNVDHPILRISWADALDGVWVFALTTLVLSFWVNPQSQAAQVGQIAAIAALVTVFTDTFCF
jgi:hypothetical protein